MIEAWEPGRWRIRLPARPPSLALQRVCSINSTTRWKPQRDIQKNIALADQSVIVQRATAHELLHAFNVVHDEAIMCANVMMRSGANGGLVTDKHLQTLRNVEAPTISRSKEQTCK